MEDTRIGMLDIDIATEIRRHIQVSSKLEL